jgi:hypothetical protein
MTLVWSCDFVGVFFCRKLLYKGGTLNKYGTQRSNGGRKYANGVITEETPLIESGQFNRGKGNSELGKNIS